MKLNIFLIVFLLVHSLDAYASTYYVDQTSGNDGNNGTSPSTAWKNAPGMSAYSGSGSLQPGDTVYFDSADIWLVTGAQGLYLVGGVTYIGDSWGTGTRAEIKANADLDAGVVRFRDHPTILTIFKGFDVNGNGRVNSGIDINHRFWTLMNGATKRVQNVVVHHTSSRQSQGQYKYGIIISNNGGSAGLAENVEILDSVVHDTSRDGICLYPTDFSGSNWIRNIVVRNNVVFNTGQDPDYSAGAGIVVKGYVRNAYIEYNYIYNTHGAGIFMNGNESNHFGVGIDNVHIRHNIINTPTQPSHGNIRIYDTNVGDPKDLKIYGNIILTNTDTGGLSTAGNRNTLTLAVYNNTFYNSFVDFTNSGDVPSIDFRNNLIYYTSGAPFQARSGIVTTHTHNIYYRGSGTLVSVGSTAYNAGNLSAFEGTASSVNPLFKNMADLPSGFIGSDGTFSPNKDGLSLQQGSFGIDNGTSLGTLYIGSINSRTRPLGAAWDIGAYEYAGGIVSDVTPPDPPSNLRVL
jgi:hypothetical protein